MIPWGNLKSYVNTLSGCCVTKVIKYFEKYSCFNCLFTDNFLFKQSTLWDIKIIKALHDLFKKINCVVALETYNLKSS